LVDAYGEELEFDLIRLGLRLRDIGRTFTWRDFKVIVANLPTDSAVVRAELGQDHGWGRTEHLLAGVVDLLNILVWQPTSDGQKNRNRPSPIPRPGVQRRVGHRTTSMDDMAEWLRTRREQQT
jgi:hypothetical protein